MKKYLDTLAVVEQIIHSHASEHAVVEAARKLEVVLLRVAVDTIKPVKLVHGLTALEASLATDPNGKILAIKRYRDRTGLGLKEAKDAVEDYMQNKLGFKYWPAHIQS